MKKRKEEKGILSAQSSIEFLILAGIVMVLLIPLFYYTTGNVDTIREQRIAEGAQSVKNAVSTLLELGEKSKTVEIITNPSGIQGYTIQGNVLNILFQGYNISTIFPIPIYGLSKWPITEGTHRINIYNEGEYIVFAECGNSIQEAFEQCDGTDTSCLSCTAPGSAQECQCTCSTTNDCPAGSVCEQGICVPSNECPPGTDYILGKCCVDEDNDGYYAENTVCAPLDCDDASPTTYAGALEDCADGKDNDCDGLIDCNDPSCCTDPACSSSPTCSGGETCGNGYCGSGETQANCPSDCSFGLCGNGVIDGAEECDDHNIIPGDGCSTTCQQEITLLISPSSTFPNKQVKFSVKETSLGYFQNEVIEICKSSGCNAGGSCLIPNEKVCEYDVSIGQVSCIAAAPSSIGQKTYWACTAQEADDNILTVKSGFCGDGYCGYGENSVNCPTDCFGMLCGNGIPNPGENCANCPSDVGCPSSQVCNPFGTCVSGQPPGSSSCEPCCGGLQTCGNELCCGTSCGTCTGFPLTFCDGYSCMEMPGEVTGCDPPQCFGDTCVEWLCADGTHPACNNNCCGDCGGGGGGNCPPLQQCVSDCIQIICQDGTHPACNNGCCGSCPTVGPLEGH